MNTNFEARLRALEDDLEKRLQGIEDAASRREELQESRHVENSKRLKTIEDTLLETAVYFKIGRWVMVAAWSIGSAVLTALSMKWTGAPK